MVVQDHCRAHHHPAEGAGTTWRKDRDLAQVGREECEKRYHPGDVPFTNEFTNEKKEEQYKSGCANKAPLLQHCGW